MPDPDPPGSDDADPGKPDPDGSAPPTGKRPWQRPHMDTGTLFESNSLSCAKVGVEPMMCIESAQRS